MSLLDRMVGATPSQAALSETRSDAELRVEIAPAMLVKLREDGSARGWSVASTLNLLWGIWLMNLLATQNLKPIAERSGLPSYFFWGLGVTLALQIALPFFFKRRSVQNE